MLLKVTSSLAQGTPVPAPRVRPDPDYQQVSVPVPRAVSLITDVASVLFSRDANKDKVQDLIERRRIRSEKQDQSVTITLPKNRLTRSLGLVD
ncbi:hypothetical protein I2I05_04750 [Hymenobacter sp. BT683]|uniref:Uncharacterized protein n=1 Tax=Hymenobacter jeongseonensis TaxID=2791027 RepID=A0ABS0IEC4_9BACT|nr:hypothetical protein [Hymenobacter jeongseonensis]MBF9236696.1 hypothetical protein [Hymenobacter jeongseonensis]